MLLRSLNVAVPNRRNWVAYIALVVSIGSVVLSYAMWKKGQDAERWARSMSAAPVLRVDSIVPGDSILLWQPDFKLRLSQDSTSAYMEANASYTIRCYLRNTGTSTASLAGWSCFPDTSEYRTFLNRLAKGKVAPWPSRAVVPGDTCSMEMVLDVPSGRPERGEFLVHVVLLYTNPEGSMFDTYLWAEAKPATIGTHVLWVVRRVGHQVMRGRFIEIDALRYDCALYTPRQQKAVIGKVMSCLTSKQK
jgi:hypothetical protein